MDRTLWYTINYEKLDALEQEYFSQKKPCNKERKGAKKKEKSLENGIATHSVNLAQCNRSDCTNALGQNDQMQKVNLAPPIPKTNTEITTESTPSIYPGSSPEKKDGMEYAETEDMVRELIAADYLKQQYNPDEIEELVLLITDTLCSSKAKIRIGREWMPKEVVHSRLLKLNEIHIACVLDSRREIPTKIHNIHAYLLTALYNAPTCSTHKVAADVEYDSK